MHNNALTLDHLPTYDYAEVVLRHHGGIGFLFFENMFEMPKCWLEDNNEGCERPDLELYWELAPAEFWVNITKQQPTLMHWPQHPAHATFDGQFPLKVLSFLEKDFDCFALWYSMFAKHINLSSFIGLNPKVDCFVFMIN